MKKLLALLLALLLSVSMVCGMAEQEIEIEVDLEEGCAYDGVTWVEYGEAYYSCEEVALYLYAFGCLPVQYLTKNDARDLGWSASAGNLWKVTDGGCIGGDHFGNYEKLLPTERGRSYYECDVNYEGGYRNGERIVFSNDGLIYYSASHYEDFELLFDGWYDPEYIYPGETEGAEW